MKKTLQIKAHEKAHKTTVYFGNDLVTAPFFFELCQKLGSKIVIISDARVGDLYGKSLYHQLKAKDFDCSFLVFPSGEHQKNRANKETLENQLLAAHCARDTALIALGGGVVTDLVGFVAATYLRGIPYLSLPTSLIGMVDASIGGKTGINTEWGKNTLGALYPPRAVVIDYHFLATLSEQERRQGIAEIVKYGLTAQASLFHLIDQNINRWLQWDLSFIEELIDKSCSIKKKVIEADVAEWGKRRMLNFGHTIAHAIEQVEAYQIGHGEAVAIGIITESLISYRAGRLTEKELTQIDHLIRDLGFSLTLSPRVTTAALLAALQSDKKRATGQVRFVLLDAIGKVAYHRGNYCTPIDDDLLHETLSWMIATFSKKQFEEKAHALSH
ncbi:MAG: 3-dehydroquinate synthase [Chlamydiota bacterium]